MAKVQKKEDTNYIKLLQEIYSLPARKRRGIIAPTNTTKIVEETRDPLKNPKIRFVRDKYGRYHDKSCDKLHYYSPDTVTYLPSVGANVEFHSLCYRKALIRMGIDINEQKNIEKYVDYFERNPTYPQMLKDLFLLRGAKMRLISKDMLEITLDNERWKIEYDYIDNNYILWHNSYYLINGERVFTGDFHVQDIKFNDTFAHVAYNILHYKWDYRKHHAIPSYDDWE